MTRAPWLEKIAAWQAALNRHLTARVEQFKQTGRLAPILSMLAIAFLYGLVHAAGPGHGKTVAALYLAARGRRMRTGLGLCLLIGLVHGLSGIGLVLVLYYGLQAGLSGSLNEVNRITTLVSYGLIAALGAALFLISLRAWRRPGRDRPEDIDQSGPGRRSLGLGLVLGVGLVPCPGVVLVTLFCLSQNLIWLGVVLALAVTLGMAATISAVGLTVLAGKNVSLGLVKKRPRAVDVISRLTESLAGLMILALGVLFLAAAW
jgi:ABC-type nickel/cobalt efflux system permease component RcnA